MLRARGQEQTISYGHDRLSALMNSQKLRLQDLHRTKPVNVLEWKWGAPKPQLLDEKLLTVGGYGGGGCLS